MNIFKSIFGGGTSQDVAAAVAKGAVIIDVRSAGEFASGHAKGAINIPLDQLDAKLSKIKAYKKPIVLCCASGMRSARAKSFLASQGVADLYDAGSWRNV